MARPTKEEVSTLEFSWDGSPWAKIATKDSIDLDTLEYSWDGSPWYGVEAAGDVVEEFVPIVMWFLEI